MILLGSCNIQLRAALSASSLKGIERKASAELPGWGAGRSLRSLGPSRRESRSTGKPSGPLRGRFLGKGVSDMMRNGKNECAFPENVGDSRPKTKKAGLLDKQPASVSQSDSH
jgi:hypothetical protein